MPDRGQEEIFAHSAEPRVCAAGSPTVVGRRTDGGLRISGKFPFASGCSHATWGGLGVQIEDDVHNVVGQVVGFVPISELEIEDTWFVAGMCGTGSNTLVAKDILVPDHRILPTTKILSGDHPARRHSGEPSDKYAFSAANSLIGIAPVLGIAHAMLENVIEGTRKRGITFTTYARQADSAVAQHEIAEAALQIDGAWLQVMHAAAQVENSQPRESRWTMSPGHVYAGSLDTPRSSSARRLMRLLPSAVRVDSRIQARSSECGAMPASRRDMDWSQPILVWRFTAVR